MTDIVQFSRVNKCALQKYILGRYWDYVPENLQELQKHKLNAMFLLSLETPAELCRFFNTSIHQLEEIINKPEYQHYTIPKKSGGERHIFAPENKLKQIQKRLNYYLQAYYLWIKPSEVHGFVINPHYLGAYCNIAANAAVHKGRKYILTIDLKDFFPTI
jgi:RNA-directed DNA polymerase